MYSKTGAMTPSERLGRAFQRQFSDGLLVLGARLSMAGIFFAAGRTKVDGLLRVRDMTIDLFRDEYRLPLIDPAIAAHLAAYAEHLLPLLLVLGLATRWAASGMLVMAAVIELLVYPAAWPTHLSWAVLLLLIITRGPGRWSLDHRLARRCA